MEIEMEVGFRKWVPGPRWLYAEKKELGSLWASTVPAGLPAWYSRLWIRILGGCEYF